jgi:hypothetical protein
MFAHESKILEGLIHGPASRNGIPCFDPIYFNCNLSSETELVRLIEENHLKFALIINYSGVDSDSIGVAKRLKASFPELVIALEERDKRRVKISSYKPEIGFVLHNIDWAEFPTELVFQDIKHFSFVWHQQPQFKRKYNLLEFKTGKKQCLIIEGKNGPLTEIKGNDNSPVYDGLAKKIPREGEPATLIIPQIFSSRVPLQEMSFTRELQAATGCEYLDMNISNPNTALKHLKTPRVVVVANFSFSNDALGVAKQMKSINPELKVILLEYKSNRLKESGGNPCVDFVVYSGAIWKFLKSPAVSAALLLPGTSYRYGQNVIVNPPKRKIGEALPIKATLPLPLIIPPLFEINQFPSKMISADSEMMQGIKHQASGYDPILINLNLEHENELVSIIESKKISSVLIVNPVDVKSDAYGLARRLKSKFPKLHILLDERDKKRIKPSSYKAQIDIVLHSISWRTFPIGLVLQDQAIFSSAWHKNMGSLKQECSLTQFLSGGKQCMIISGKVQTRNEQHPWDNSLVNRLAQRYFGSGKITAVLSPKIFSNSPTTAEICLASKLSEAIDAKRIDLNIEPYSPMQYPKVQVVVINHFSVENNALEIASSIKSASPDSRVIAVEHKPSRLRETAAKECFDFVVHASSLDEFIKKFPGPGCLFIPGTSYCFGGNVIVNPIGAKSKKPPMATDSKEVTRLSLFGFEQVTSCSLIIPKFYEKYPEGVYELARSCYAAVDGLTYQDGNIIPIIPDKQVNCGLFFEGFKSNLLDVFGEAKKSNPSARNCVIYYGSDVTSARKLLLHPHVDCLVYASGATPVFLKSLLEGKADLLKLSFKYGGNVINPGMLPGPLPKINNSLTSSDLALSSSVDGGKLSSSLRTNFKSDSASLIVPKFYEKYGIEEYNLAAWVSKTVDCLGINTIVCAKPSKIFDTGPWPVSCRNLLMDVFSITRKTSLRHKFPLDVYRMVLQIAGSNLTFLDYNFGARSRRCDLNIGIWFEGFKSNLLEVFSTAKKVNGSVKNVVIFHGTNQKETMGVFANPCVDALVCSTDVTPMLIYSLINGKANLNGIMFKYNGNLINQRQVLHGSGSGRKMNQEGIISNKLELQLSEIDPIKWHSSSWDRFGPRIWKGDEQYSQGLSTAFGDDFGFFEYSFDCPLQGAQRLDIFAKVSSHSHKDGKIPDAASDVTLLINGEEIETRRLYFESNRSSFVEHWKIEGVKLKNKGNSLTFKVNKTAKHRKGLTMFGPSLTDEHKQLELPILLFFRK